MQHGSNRTSRTAVAAPVSGGGSCMKTKCGAKTQDTTAALWDDMKYLHRTRLTPQPDSAPSAFGALTWAAPQQQKKRSALCATLLLTPATLAPTTLAPTVLAPAVLAPAVLALAPLALTGMAPAHAQATNAATSAAPSSGTAQRTARRAARPSICRWARCCRCSRRPTSGFVCKKVPKLFRRWRMAAC